MPPLAYELFLRRAFGIKKGEMVSRWDDPVGIANADFFLEENLDRIKGAVVYSMEIFCSAVAESRAGTLEDREYERIGSFPPSVMRASSLAEVSKLIDEYQKTVVNTYLAQGEKKNLFDRG